MAAFSDYTKFFQRKEFLDYFQAEVVNRSKLVQAGIVAPDAAIAARCNAAGFGGSTVDLPFFNQLADGTTGMVAIGDGTEIPVSTLSDAVDRAVITYRAAGFGATDFTAAMTGADPMGVIAGMAADFLNAQLQKQLVATLDGALGAASGLVNTLAKGTEIDAGALLDAAQLLGDNKDRITAYAMNSKTATGLNKQDFATVGYVPSAGSYDLGRFMGKTLVVDDAIADGTVYLFAPGAVAYNPCPVAVPFETHRDAQHSQSALFFRTRHILHVRGIAWTGTVVNPTDEQLKAASNWKLVYPKKAVRVAKVTVAAG